MQKQTCSVSLIQDLTLILQLLIEENIIQFWCMVNLSCLSSCHTNSEHKPTFFKTSFYCIFFVDLTHLYGENKYSVVRQLKEKLSTLLDRKSKVTWLYCSLLEYFRFVCGALLHTSSGDTEGWEYPLPPSYISVPTTPFLYEFDAYHFITNCI